jgi:single-strand DNA-binding protein
LSSQNKIILVGRVAYDPDQKVTTNGSPLLKFCLDVERPSRGAVVTKKSDLINIVAWSPIADNPPAFSKDSLLLVEGRINVRSYDDQEGKRKWVTEVDAREIQVLNAVASSTNLNSQSAEVLDANTDFSPIESLEEKPLDQIDTSSFDFGAEDKKIKDVAVSEPEAQTQEVAEVPEDIPF